MSLINAASHGRLIQRRRAQETGHDRKTHLGAIWQVGGVTGGGEMVKER